MTVATSERLCDRHREAAARQREGARVGVVADGTGAAAMVASGEAGIAVMPVSEIVHASGIELAGVIAEEIQLNQIFAAAVVEGSKEIEAAKRLIAFLASERASATIKRSGMEPVARHPSE